MFALNYELIGHDIPYIHYRALVKHVLQLTVTHSRKNNSNVKQYLSTITFQKVTKKIKENMLHDVQQILEEPLLIIPEVSDIRWFIH